MSTASRVFAGLNILLLLGGLYLGLGVLNIHRSYAKALASARSSIEQLAGQLASTQDADLDSAEPGVRALAVKLHRLTHDRGGLWFVTGGGPAGQNTDVVQLNTVAVAPPEQNLTLNPLTGSPQENAPPAASGAPFPTGVDLGARLHVFAHTMNREAPQGAGPGPIVSQSLRYLGPVRVAQVGAAGVQATVVTRDEAAKQVLQQRGVPLLIAESLPSDDPALFAGMTNEEAAALGIDQALPPNLWAAYQRVGEPVPAGEQPPADFVRLEATPQGRFAEDVQGESIGGGTTRVLLDGSEFGDLAEQNLVDSTPAERFFTRPVWNYGEELDSLRRRLAAGEQAWMILDRDRQLLELALAGAQAEGEFRLAQGGELRHDRDAIQAEIAALEQFIGRIDDQIAGLQAEIDQLSDAAARSDRRQARSTRETSGRTARAASSPARIAG